MDNLVSIMVDIHDTDIDNFLSIIKNSKLKLEFASGPFIFDANDILNLFIFDLNPCIELIIHYNTNDDYIKFITLLNENKIKFEGV